MKKFSFLLLSTIIFFSIFFNIKIALAESIASRLKGQIVLQVEEHGEAWYINPKNLRRYYLGRPKDAFNIMKFLGVGITNKNLKKIPTNKELWDGDIDLLNRLRGYIVLQVEKHGEAWYINPINNKRYYLGKPSDAFNLMKRFGMGISTANLKKISSNSNDDYQAKQILLSVPFTSQAPFADWSAPYNEACEEANLVMLDHYYRGVSLSAEEANAEILRLIDWENANYGYSEDTSVEATGNMAKDVYGWNYETDFNINAEQIKQSLREGTPVIIPVAGNGLGNPHFRSSSPFYHMLLIIGFNETSFITNDSGTHYGEKYIYPQDTLIQAIHDLTNPETNISQGIPAMLTFSF